jgi:hypothetical protein
MTLIGIAIGFAVWVVGGLLLAAALYLSGQDPLAAFIAGCIVSAFAWTFIDIVRTCAREANRGTVTTTTATVVPETIEPPLPSSLDDPDWI